MHLPGQLMAVENLDVLPLDFYDALFLQIGQDSEKGELLNAERVGYLLPGPFKMDLVATLFPCSFKKEVGYFLPYREKTEYLHLMRQEDIDIRQDTDKIHTDGLIRVHQRLQCLRLHTEQVDLPVCLHTHRQAAVL